jgi:hypothetical protein
MGVCSKQWAQKLQKQKDFQMTLTNHDKSRPSIK